MPTDPLLATKPFRLGVPTLPGRNGTAIDPFAQRAIEEIGNSLAGRQWLDDKPARAQFKATVTDEQTWRSKFIEPRLRDPYAELKPCKDGIALEELLAKRGLTGLIQKVRQLVRSERRPLNTAALLGNDNLFLFSFAQAYYVDGIDDPEGIAAHLVDTNRGAVKGLYQLVAVAAFDDYVQSKKVEVDDTTAFKTAVIAEVRKDPVAFAVGAFEHYLKRFVDDYAYRRNDTKLIKDTSDELSLKITPEEVSYLARYFTDGTVRLTDTNRKNVIPPVLTQYRSTVSGSAISAAADTGPLDFGVTYHTESLDTAAVNTENVRCAAQLFYVMTLGDELGVFRATELLVTRKLGATRIDVTAPQLLADLQDYAFNEKFRYGNIGREHQRTSSEERQMFYRQVFDLGDTTLLDGMVTNTDFTALWSSLMVETVRYIEKFERSEQPESYVSRNGVAQVMSDLQYNLSTYASGMAKVMTPIMYRELDFLIERVWKSPEIVQQVGLHGTRSYWRAIEGVLEEDQGRSVGLTALLKKAEYGHVILSAIADYSPAMVLDDANWFQLVGTIEAFIIANEQLASESGPGYRQPARVGADPIGPSTVGPVDDWAF